MKALTAQQMRETDRLTTERYGISSLQLMENAGAAIAEYLWTTYPGLHARSVVILCGKGNNGGDGFVIARRLRERGVAPHVILFADPAAVHGDAATNLKSWQQQMGDLRVVTVVTSVAEWKTARAAVADADLVVDALLGTGLKGPVEGLLAQVVADVNVASTRSRARAGSRRLHVVAVDMPSGLASDGQDYGGPIISAEATVTLTAPKIGQLVSPRADCVGKLVVRQIGTPPALLEDDARLTLHWLEPGELLNEARGLPLIRPRDAHKGNFGHALIAAGSLGKSGAAVLAGRAALRAGAGLVTVATPLDVLPIVAAGMPEFMTAPLITGTARKKTPSHGAFAGLLRDKSVLAMGPGLGTSPETQKWIRKVVATTELPLILDADGLNAFASRPDELKSRKTPHLAITPHPGEMARLLGIKSADVQSRRLEVAREAAARWRAFVILKGFHTILATPDGRAFINTNGNPGMAKGGTGDVLTGILAGLTAEFGIESWERVLGLGIYLHGLAADLAAARVGEIPLIATELIEAMPVAFAQFLGERSHARD
jgi:ADP-dependent NAD(P)H-hydrate dehydratase / NAD(P)H-hydrate epimerase